MKAKMIFVAAGLMGFAAISTAQVNIVTDRGSIGANDQINWDQFGTSGTGVAEGSIGSSVTLNPFQLSSDSQAMERLDQGNGFAGDYVSGDPLLFSGFTTDGTDGTISILLGQSVNAFGADIQANAYGAFTAVITAYDGLGNVVGSFSENGVSGGNGNGNGGDVLPFLGIASANANIQRVVFSLSASQAPGDGFTVNEVSLHECNPVPEPASIAVLGLGALALVRRRRS